MGKASRTKAERRRTGAVPDQPKAGPRQPIGYANRAERRSGRERTVYEDMVAAADERDAQEAEKQSKIAEKLRESREAYDALSDEEKAAREVEAKEMEELAEKEIGPFLESMQRRKADLVRDAKPGQNDDITPWIDLYRDGKHVASVLCSRVDRDQALEAIHALVPSMEIDRVSLCVDAHMATQMTNPETGKDWGPNEMQGLCDRLGYCETGLITDCIYIVDHTRDGRQLWGQALYHAHHSADDKPGEVVWVENRRPSDDDSDDKVMPKFMGARGESSAWRLGGYVTDVIESAFKVPTFDQRVAELGREDESTRKVLESLDELRQGLTPEEERAHRDCGIAKGFMLAKRGEYAVMLTADNEVRAEIIKRSFENLDGDLEVVAEYRTRSESETV